MRAYDPVLQQQWRDDVGMRLRFPRVGYKEVIDGVLSAWPPTVFMREHKTSTDIVIRFPWSSEQLSSDDKWAFFDNRVPLTRVFEDHISRTTAKGQSTVERKVANQAYDAYKMTWLLLLRSSYLEEGDPRHLDKNDPSREPHEWLATMEKIFRGRKPPGRPKKNESEQLQRRFTLLLGHCGWLHREIGKYQKQKRTKIEGNLRHVRQRFWRGILKVPGGLSILGGEAFSNIPYGKELNRATLEDPASWNPRQLAISLLALEREQDYHTVERKVPQQRKPKHSSSCK